MDKKQSRKIEYESKIASGRCVSCGTDLPPNDTHRLCAACREKMRISAKLKYDQRKVMGVCAKCGASPLKEGFLFCEACCTRNTNNKRRKRELKKAGAKDDQ